MPTESPESIDYEEKSSLTESKKDRLKLVKTIVAMANSQGGEMRILSFNGNTEKLDSARLDDSVNRYAAPRVEGIEATEEADGGWRITVPKSDAGPHMFVKETSYEDAEGKVHSAFYPGQIYARHSSKTEPATEDDLRAIVDGHVGRWLRHIATAIQDFSLELAEGGAGTPARLSETGAGLAIAVRDPNRDFPYTAKTLAQKLDRGQNWVVKALGVLRLRGNPAYSMAIRGASGRIVVRKYNERTLDTLWQKLSDDPSFDPHHP